MVYIQRGGRVLTSLELDGAGRPGVYIQVLVNGRGCHGYRPRKLLDLQVRGMNIWERIVKQEDVFMSGLVLNMYMCVCMGIRVMITRPDPPPRRRKPDLADPDLFLIDLEPK